MEQSQNRESGRMRSSTSIRKPTPPLSNAPTTGSSSIPRSRSVAGSVGRARSSTVTVGQYTTKVNIGTGRAVVEPGANARAKERAAFNTSMALSGSMTATVGGTASALRRSHNKNYVTISQRESEVLDNRPFHDILKDPFVNQVDPLTSDSLAKVKELLRNVDREFDGGGGGGVVSRAEGEEGVPSERPDLSTMLSGREAERLRSQQDKERGNQYWDGRSAQEVEGRVTVQPKPEGEVLLGCPEGVLDVVSAAPSGVEPLTAEELAADEGGGAPSAELPPLPRSSKDLFEVSAHHATVVITDEMQKKAAAAGGKATSKPKRILSNPFSAAVEEVRSNLVDCRGMTELIFDASARLRHLVTQLDLPAESLFFLECESAVGNLTAQCDKLLNGLYTCESTLSSLSAEVMKRDDSVSSIEAKMRAAKEQLLSTQLERDEYKQEVWQHRVCTRLRGLVKKRRELKAARIVAGNNANAESPYASKPKEASSAARRTSIQHTPGGHEQQRGRTPAAGEGSGQSRRRRSLSVISMAVEATKHQAVRVEGAQQGGCGTRTVLQMCIDQYGQLWEHYPASMVEALEILDEAVQRALTSFGGTGRLIYRGRGGTNDATNVFSNPLPPSERQSGVGVTNSEGIDVSSTALDGGYFLFVFKNADDAINFAVSLQYMSNYLPWPAPLVESRWKGEGPIAPPTPFVTGKEGRQVYRGLTPTVFYDDCPPPANESDRLLMEYCEQHKGTGNFDYEPSKEIFTRMCRLVGRQKELDTTLRRSGLLFRGPRLRMGVHSGTVLTECPPGTLGSTGMHVYGSAVMKAAKLCGRARGGEILCSLQTHQLIAAHLQRSGTFAQQLSFCRLAPTVPLLPSEFQTPKGATQETASDFHLFESEESVFQILPGRQYRRGILLGKLPADQTAIRLRTTVLFNPNWWIRFNTAAPHYSELPLTVLRQRAAALAVTEEADEAGGESSATSFAGSRSSSVLDGFSVNADAASPAHPVDVNLSGVSPFGVTASSPTAAPGETCSKKKKQKKGGEPHLLVHGLTPTEKLTLTEGLLQETRLEKETVQRQAAYGKLKFLKYEKRITGEECIGLAAHDRCPADDAIGILSTLKVTDTLAYDTWFFRPFTKLFAATAISSPSLIATAQSTENVVTAVESMLASKQTTTIFSPSPQPEEGAPAARGPTLSRYEQAITPYVLENPVLQFLAENCRPSDFGRYTSASASPTGSHHEASFSPRSHQRSFSTEEYAAPPQRGEPTSIGGLDEPAAASSPIPERLVYNLMQEQALVMLAQVDSILLQLSRLDTPQEMRRSAAFELTNGLNRLRKLLRWVPEHLSFAVVGHYVLRCLKRYAIEQLGVLPANPADGSDRPAPTTGTSNIHHHEGDGDSLYSPLGYLDDFNGFLIASFPTFAAVDSKSWCLFQQQQSIRSSPAMSNLNPISSSSSGSSSALAHVPTLAIQSGIELWRYLCMNYMNEHWHIDDAVPNVGTSGSTRPSAHTRTSSTGGGRGGGASSASAPSVRGPVVGTEGSLSAVVRFLVMNVEVSLSDLSQTRGGNAIALPTNPFTGTQHLHPRSGHRFNSCHAYLGPLSNGSAPLCAIMESGIQHSIGSQTSLFRIASQSGRNQTLIARLFSLRALKDEKTNQLLVLAPNIDTVHEVPLSEQLSDYLKSGDRQQFVQYAHFLVRQLALMHAHGLPHGAVSPQFVALQTIPDKPSPGHLHQSSMAEASMEQRAVGGTTGGGHHSPSGEPSPAAPKLIGLVAAGLHWHHIHSRTAVADVDAIPSLLPFMPPERLREIASLIRAKDPTAIPGLAFPMTSDWNIYQASMLKGDVWGLGMTLLFSLCKTAPFFAREFARPQPLVVLNSLAEEMEKLSNPTYLGRLLQQKGRNWLFQRPTATTLSSPKRASVSVQSPAAGAAAATGQTPHHSQHHHQEHLPPLLPMLFDLLVGMLKPNPAERISMEAALKHPLFATVPLQATTGEVCPSALLSLETLATLQKSLAAGEEQQLAQEATAATVGAAFSTAGGEGNFDALCLSSRTQLLQQLLQHVPQQPPSAGARALERHSSGFFSASLPQGGIVPMARSEAPPPTALSVGALQQSGGRGGTGTGTGGEFSLLSAAVDDSGPLFQLVLDQHYKGGAPFSSAAGLVGGGTGADRESDTATADHQSTLGAGDEADGEGDFSLPSLELRSVERHPTFVLQRKATKECRDRYAKAFPPDGI